MTANKATQTLKDKLHTMNTTHKENKDVFYWKQDSGDGITSSKIW
jgi:hypothetical protein